MTMRVGVLTVSDRVSAGAMEDRGGPAVESALAGSGWEIVERHTVPDEVDEIVGYLKRWADEDGLDVIFTTGGTGLAPRDVTPEATAMAAPRSVPGIAESIRSAGLASTRFAMISRGTAAVRGATLIINLPGSPQGASDGVAVVLPVLEHAVSILHSGSH